MHIGQPDVAAKIHNAWLRTLEDGVHTGDVYRDGVSKERVGTQDFAKAVVARLGQKPSTMPAVHYAAGTPKALEGRTSNRKPAKKELVGIDMFVAWTGEVDAIGKQIKALEGDGLSLVMLSNKGLKVWPDVALDGMHITDQFRCRFRMPEGKTVNHAALVALLGRAASAGLDFTKTELLYTFDGALGFSLGQGE